MTAGIRGDKMTMTTNDNGNTRPSPPVEDALGMVIALVLVCPLLVGVGWVVVNLFRLAGILDQPY